jgi:hypothetical protein
MVRKINNTDFNSTVTKNFAVLKFVPKISLGLLKVSRKYKV